MNNKLGTANRVGASNRFLDYRYQRTVEANSRKTNFADSNTKFGSILGVVVIVVIFAGLMSTLLGTEPSIVHDFSLENFMSKLQYIGDHYTIDMNWIDSIHVESLDSEWAILDGVRVFLNTFIDGFKFVLIISVGLIQVLLFLVGCLNVLIL